MTTHLFTVDVEDNFTRAELADPADWERYEGQVVENTERVLRLLRDFGVEGTFFVVGHTAERHPELVERILAEGHEVASHSYAHERLDEKDWEAVREDLRRGTEVLRDIGGRPVLGFRAMDFSIPRDEDRFLELLAELGCRYDSSALPADGAGPTLQPWRDGRLYRVYPSRMRILNRNVTFCGGSYLRLLPFAAVRRGLRHYTARNEPAVLYVHPWEFNRDQPRRRVGLGQRLRQSPWTFNTERRLRRLLREFRFTSVRRLLGLES